MTKIPRVLKQALAGDSAAISSLYQLHVDAIYRYILYRVPTSHDAEDLTAEVFLKMVKDLPNYQWTGAPFEAWLYRIAAARIADFHRKNRRHPDVDLNDTLTDHIPLPEEQLQQAQEVENLRQVLNQLSEDEQTILILRFVERKSHQEVAHIMGKTPAAVKTMQHRALVQLAALLGSEEKARHYLRGRHD
ncbi:MAG: sigma-70 family RNA polymerase sigma factor [Anaerolineae bacterium]|nr:sigma-70 family RNA polymerase sigma factor [Anaerolineae bacterium]